MTDLHASQAAFQRHLLGAASDIGGNLHGNSRAPVDIMLNIYKFGYVARLVECLANDFPALSAMLGERRFARLARGYVAAYPSRQPSVRWLGGNLARFIADSTVPIYEAAIQDMARFEWALAHAFDAADDGIVSLHDISAMEPQSWALLCFEFAASVTSVALTTPAPANWQRLIDGKPMESAPNEEPRTWLVWRQEFELRFHPAEPDEVMAFDLIRGGGTFGEMCEALGATISPDESTLRAAQILKGWLDWGMIAHVRLKDLSSRA